MITKREAQEKSIAYLKISAAYEAKDLSRMEKFAVVATAWATLANGLPDEVTVQDTRPFRDVVG